MKISTKTLMMTLLLSAFAVPSFAQRGPDRVPPPMDRDRGDMGRDRRDDRFGDRRTETIVINMYDQVFQDVAGGGVGGGGRPGERVPPGRGPGAGRGAELKLKMLLQQQHPNMRLMDKELVEVRMMAKSAQGNGIAELLMDNYAVDRQRVGIFLGRGARDLREAFEVGGPLTFDNVLLSANGDRGSQTWQINLTGLIKVRAIELTLRDVRGGGGRPDRPDHGRLESVLLGSMRPEQVIIDAKHFSVYEREVVEVKLQGLRRETHVESVEVQYRRGPSEVLRELSGRLDNGQIKVARVRGGGEVSAIIVRATSPRIFKGEGQIDVSVGVLK